MHSDPTTPARLGRIGAIQRLAAQSTALPECAPPKDLSELKILVSGAIAAVMSGKLPPKTGNAVGSLASVLLTILRTTDLADRVAALESWRQQRMSLRRVK